MTPEWELHLGDCLEGLRRLPDRSVDVFLMDPPYSEHVHTRSRRGCIEHEPGTGRAAFNRSRDLGFEHLTHDAREGAARECARLARRWVVAFSDLESAHLWREAFEGHGLEYVRTLVWDKEGGTPQFTGDRPAIACEAMTLAHPFGRKRWNGGGKRGIYSVPIMLDRAGDGARVHTAQKPDLLMEQLVADFSDGGEMVCDPFAGSGTTGVAAVRLRRRFLGWESSPTFHAAALKRLSQTRVQYELLPRGPKPKQHRLDLGTAEAPQAPKPDEAA